MGGSAKAPAQMLMRGGEFRLHLDWDQNSNFLKLRIQHSGFLVFFAHENNIVGKWLLWISIQINMYTYVVENMKGRLLKVLQKHILQGDNISVEFQNCLVTLFWLISSELFEFH